MGLSSVGRFEVFFFFALSLGGLYLEGLINFLEFQYCSIKLAIAQQNAGPK